MVKIICNNKGGYFNTLNSSIWTNIYLGFFILTQFICCTSYLCRVFLFLIVERKILVFYNDEKNKIKLKTMYIGLGKCDLLWIN